MTQSESGPEGHVPQVFMDELTESMRWMDESLKKLKQGWDADAAYKIQMSAHKLVGSSAMLGFHQISETARGIELTASDAIAEGSSGVRQKLAIILAERFADLNRVISLDTALDRLLGRYIDDTGQAVHSLQESRAGQQIFLVEDDAFQADELASQIGYFGYRVRIFHRLEEIRPALESELPSAILMDIVFPDSDTAGTDAIQQLHDRYPVLVIFISVREDAVARLNALRAGGEAYFTKPVNVSTLIETIDRLTIKADPLPCRILIVDDSSAQANFTSLHLVRAGMEVRSVNDPLKSLDALVEFSPDLILLDMYMPECTGMELAAIIRQMEAYVSIPIVFLSSETDRDKQLEAVGLGGDDFLTKPIQPAHLVASVTSRVERYRKLRALMLHDSLTGLFNHTTTRERLSMELLRAARQSSPLSYAMIDIDFFKKVNDTYGHATGDRVLKSLSQLLSKRLRHSDTIGRYGGEEFAVIFPGTTGETACGIMENLRMTFADLLHHAGDQEFTVTFSCGIATFPEHTTIASLSEAADQALYEAKHRGRNQVRRAAGV